MSSFMTGRELSSRFFVEVLRPLLDRHFPLLLYSAAHIGPGSDVLGFDTEMSTDHDWGPRLMLLLRATDISYTDAIDTVFRRELPRYFYGFPVSITTTGTEDDTAQSAKGVADHRVTITTVSAFVWYHLAYALDQPLTAADWLTFPAQILRELTGGTVHHDGLGELTTVRDRLSWYPHDVWLYILASGWNRIGQEEHLMPRAGYIGDELGSAIIGSRLVRDVMSLCFLYERHYAPYPKWFGSAFQQLSSNQLTPVLQQAQYAPTWQERESALTTAYTYLADVHNTSGITDRLPDTVSLFYNRPFQVIHGGAFADAIRARITDPEVRHIAARPLIGNIDQISDNTDIHGIGNWRPLLRALFQ